ncbi:MAG: hypothetical protein ACK41F_01795 [Fimbriimonadaceae bacterium]
MKTMILRALPALAMASLGGPALAVIDFESQATGLVSSLSATDQGVTATFFNGGSEMLAVWNLSPYSAPASWGSRSVWSGGSSSASGPTTGNFSEGLSWVSMEFGDFGADDDQIFLRAYSGLDGSGSLLGSVSLFYDSSRALSNDDFVTLSVGSATPIRSILFGSVGYQGLNNIYFDNVRFEKAGVPAVPGPLAALPFALGLLASRRRKRS